MNLKRSEVVAGLGTRTYTITAADGKGMYRVNVRSTEIPISGLVITIAQSGSTTVSVNTGANSPVQSFTNLDYMFACAVGDVLTVTFSSANSVDTLVSQIKSVISIKQGT